MGESVTLAWWSSRNFSHTMQWHVDIPAVCYTSHVAHVHGNVQLWTCVRFIFVACSLWSIKLVGIWEGCLIDGSHALTLDQYTFDKIMYNVNLPCGIIIWSMYTGISPSPRLWLQWNMNALEPANIKQREELMMQAKKDKEKKGKSLSHTSQSYLAHWNELLWRTYIIHRVSTSS